MQAAPVVVAVPPAVDGRGGSAMQFVAVKLRTLVMTASLTLGISVPHTVAAPNTDATIQSTYATADEAVAAMVDALKADDTKRLLAVLGPGSENLVNSGDRHADSASRQRFMMAYDLQHKLTETSPGHDILIVGQND
jgi:hypothetical protein